jgi:dTDP-glucose 4,6-dehydratase
LLAAEYHLPVNLGNPDETTILEFAQELIGLTGSKSEILFKPLPEDDPVQRQPDIKLAKELLGWEPHITRREGLEKTIAYFKRLSPEELRHKEHRTFN